MADRTSRGISGLSSPAGVCCRRWEAKHHLGQVLLRALTHSVAVGARDGGHP